MQKTAANNQNNLVGVCARCARCTRCALVCAQGAQGVRAARLLFLTATGGETLPTVWAPASSVSTFRERVK